MESNTVLDSKASNNQNFSLSNNGLINLKQTRSWALFLCILGFILIGLMVLAGIIMSVVTGVGNFGASNFPEIGIALIYIVMAAIYLIPLIYLYKFTQAAQSTYNSKDPNGLDKVIQSLKGHFKSIGIIVICVFAMYIAAIIFIVGMGASGIFPK